jgi:hypothetical protein
MSKIQFKEILERYLSGTCSPDERKLVEQWYELLDEDYRMLYPDMNLEELEEIIWEKVKPETEIIALHTTKIELEVVNSCVDYLIDWRRNMVVLGQVDRYQRQPCSSRIIRRTG